MDDGKTSGIRRAPRRSRVGGVPDMGPTDKKRPAILVHLGSADELRTVKRAATAAGLTQKEFCRRAVLDAARRSTGREAEDMLGILRQIRDHVCSRPPSSMGDSEAEDAVAALVGLGIPQQTARTRVRQITTRQPGLTAGAIIAEACRQSTA